MMERGGGVMLEEEGSDDGVVGVMLEEGGDDGAGGE